MYQLKITESANGEVEIIKNVNDLSFTGGFMIICLGDLKNRLVRPLDRIISYEYKEQPVINPARQNKKGKR